jgi:hypothetical protein
VWNGDDEVKVDLALVEDRLLTVFTEDLVVVDVRVDVVRVDEATLSAFALMDLAGVPSTLS